MKIPMRLGLPFKLCFLKFFNDIDIISYENHNGECVPMTLSSHLKVTEKTILQWFNRLSNKLYNKSYEKKLNK